MQIFCERLKAARNAKNMTQSELANAIGIKLRGYQGYESGEREPSLERLAALVDALDVSSSYLLGETDNPTREAQNQSNKGDSAMPKKNEASSVDSGVIVTTSGNIVVERDRDRTRIILPPTPASYDFAYKLATEITVEATVEASEASPPPHSEPRKGVGETTLQKDGIAKSA